MRILGLALGWGWAATIVWLSLTPRPPELNVQHGDKLGHFAAYGLLTFWFCLLYHRRPTRALYLIGFIAMGVILEFLQGMTGYRTFDLWDMGANTAGALLGMMVGLSVRKPVFR